MKWLHKNLFSSSLNTMLTMAALYLLWIVVPPAIEWSLLEATWVGESRSACEPNSGACWAFVDARIEQFLYGLYPATERWRVNLAFAILFLLFIGLFLAGTIKQLKRSWIVTLILIPYPVIALYLFSGGSFGLVEVETTQWGGLFLTIVIAGVGIVASFPLGILLALARRSEMRAVRSLAIAFIELIRGVPLISVLFMASVMLPLFLPEGVNFDKLLRALIGITLFQSAYMAEVVRGGLQAVPSGQVEAAESLGLGYWSSMRLIVLPQALKLVIPGVVNTFIALFKDTTLVMIIGMFDFLGIVQAATTNPKWLGTAVEGYVFCAAVYWIFCFSMSRYSISVERKLDTGY
jgi:general L-amino acid transport system permease protein